MATTHRRRLAGPLGLLLLLDNALAYRVPTSRRQLLGAAAASVAAARPAAAVDVRRTIAQIQRDAPSTTAADFSSVIEIRPISGPAGAGQALVIVDAGNAGDFEFMWLKDSATGEILSTAYSKLPPPMMIKAAVARGRAVTPMAYSESVGLYEGDPFLVNVGAYRPDVLYPGRPDGPIGVGGKGLYAAPPPPPPPALPSPLPAAADPATRNVGPEYGV